MRCPKCSTYQPDDARDCANCGINFARWKSPDPRPAVQQQDNSKVCSACGSLITGRGLFCMKCGAAVVQPKNPTASQSMAGVALTNRPAIITHFAVIYALSALG